MKTFISLLFAIACLALPLQAQSPYASCVVGGSSSILAAGGVIAVITVYTNPSSGKSTVLPVRVKMFDDVIDNPLWNTNFNFGSDVTVLPVQNVSVPQGYMLNWIGHNNPSGYPVTYSSVYPIVIESTTGGSWTNEFYLTLYGSLAQIYVCSVPGTGHRGVVVGELWSPYDTNGIPKPITLDVAGDEMMDRGAAGAMDATQITAESRSSVAILYFNLPPAIDCDKNLMNNWLHNPFSSDTNLLKQFRVRFDGAVCCDSQACATSPNLMATKSGDHIDLSFTMQTGFMYQIYYKNNLTDSNWIIFGPSFGGSGTLDIYDNLTGPSRFYRLGYHTN
jgi:hypothetical protein